jgi:hypothetical protein
LFFKTANASVKISVVSGFSDAFGFSANLTNALPNRRAPNAIHAPFRATILASNSGLFQRFNHGQELNFCHLLLYKWNGLAIVKLDKEVLRWGQCLLHRRHEQLPMPLAIEVEKGIAKSFSSPKKCSINQVPIMPARKMASRNNMVMQIVRRMVIVHLKENHQD